MICETISLNEKNPLATLTSFICDSDLELKADPRPAMIVCPGGGYHFLSAREGEPFVRKFLGEGMNVYLLKYSIGEFACDYNPLIEAARAIKYVRENAEAHNTDPEKVFIMGFSAGGHLAASSGILWNIPEVRDAIGVTDGSAPEGINRPTGMILSYPVISGGEYSHKGSFHYLCGTKEPTEEQLAKFSLELHVDETSSPAFIWHTVTDKTVPVKNSIMITEALIEHGVPCETHIFPEGVHGLALANKETWSQNKANLVPHVEIWTELAIRWIRDQF